MLKHAKMERKAMTDILNSDETKTLGLYFFEHGWEERICNHCNSQFLTKSRNEAATCGRSDCSQLEFLNRPKRRRFLTAIDLTSQFNDFFSNIGYEKVNPASIINKTGSTLFAGTAGQIFDNIIFNEEKIDIGPKFVAQPVIRLQGGSFVGKKEGFSTSFVNIALEQLNPTIEGHVKHIDNWINFMSKIGLFMGEVTIRLVKDSPDWGGVNFDAITTKVYYGGLEIGVANWFAGIPQKSRDPLFMSDISFGLERMVWVANKSRSYFDAIGPLNYSLSGEHKLMDSYRTAALMALSDVKPGYKDRGSKLRALTKNITDTEERIDEKLIIYYINWWKKFAEFPTPDAEAIKTITNEANRNINIVIQNKLGVSESISLSLDPSEYVDKIIDSGMPFEKIRELLSS